MILRPRNHQAQRAMSRNVGDDGAPNAAQLTITHCGVHPGDTHKNLNRPAQIRHVGTALL
jgi:hypothetical protein